MLHGCRMGAGWHCRTPCATLCRTATLAASLRQLLLNDSLLDIGSRRALYLELIQLLKCLGDFNQQSASCHA